MDESDTLLKTILLADALGQFDNRSLLYCVHSLGTGNAGEETEDTGPAPQVQDDISFFHGVQYGAQKHLRAICIMQHGLVVIYGLLGFNVIHRI